jgi:hypothetical protein
VAFPFRLGHLDSSLGVVILLSAIFGSLLTLLVMTVVSATRRLRGANQAANQAASQPSEPEAIEDRPPPDYAAKTSEGFSDAPWSH